MTNPTPLPKPKEPTDNECCGNNCNPCVWDNYYEKLKQWRLTQIKISIPESTDKSK